MLVGADEMESELSSGRSALRLAEAIDVECSCFDRRGRGRGDAMCEAEAAFGVFHFTKSGRSKHCVISMSTNLKHTCRIYDLAVSTTWA